MRPWQTLACETILDHSKYLRVENHTVLLPDGRIIPDWPWVITPDYVNVLAETTEGLFLCFRQTKYGVQGTTLAVPGGYLETDEDPLAGAKRELVEETGFAAAQWSPLGSYRVGANRGFGTGHLFLAQGARQVSQPDADDLEEQQLLMLSRSELEAALSAGEFKVLAWAAVIALALRRLDLG